MRAMRDSCYTRFCVVVAMTSVIMLSIAATAQATVIKTWSGAQPIGVAGSNVLVIVSGSGIYDGYPMLASTSKLYIDGVLIPPDSYTAMSRGVSGAYFYYNPRPGLVDGAHTFRVEMSDSAGRLSAYQWGATIAQPPTARWLAPAADSMRYDGRPEISLALSDNTPTTTFTLAGQVRTGSATGPVVATFGGSGLAAGTNTFTLADELAPGTYYLTAAVTDLAGNTRVLSGATARRFTLVAASAMSVLPTNCVSAGCHSVVDRHRATGMACSSCHVYVYHMGPDCAECHEGHLGPVTVTGILGSCETCHSSTHPSVPRHTASNVGPAHASSCDGCHATSLLDKHAVTPDGSAYAYQCAMCHASSDSQVSSAVGAGSETCAACHDRVESHGDLNAIHRSTVVSGSVQVLGNHMGGVRSEVLACANCHPTMNLLQLHGDGWNNCSVCHAPGGPRSTFETWGKSCQQGDCHPTLHDNANSSASHQSVAAYGSPYCGYCHALPNYYAPLECTAVCHTTKLPLKGDSSPPLTSVVNPKAFFANPAQVQLSAIDTGSRVYGIYHRSNGSAWSFSPGTNTTVVVPVGGSGVLEYYAVDWFGNAETVRSYTITFDATPPVTLSDGGSHPVDYPWRLSASDVGSGVQTTYYSIDGGAWGVYGYYENIDGLRTDGGGGPHSLSYYSVDKVGNIEATVTVNFVIPDPYPPTSYLSTTRGPSANIMAQDYHAGALSGVKAIRYRLDGGAWVETVYPRDRWFAKPQWAYISVPADGTYQLEYYAIDYADNAEPIRSTALTIIH